MAKIFSISLPKDLVAWLDEHSFISLSEITQNAIRRQIEFENQSATHQENAALRERLQRVMDELHKRCVFIEKEGKLDQYLKEVEEM